MIKRRQFKIDVDALTAKVDVQKVVPLADLRTVATLKPDDVKVVK